MLTKLVLVGLGGALGALLRFAVSSGVHALLGRGFPYGTLSVNVLGSGLLGVFYVLSVERTGLSTELRAAVMVGLLGAFTTFSTFSLETLGLLEDGAPFKAAANVLLSVVLSVGGCWLGLALARQL